MRGADSGNPDSTRSTPRPPEIGEDTSLSATGVEAMIVEPSSFGGAEQTQEQMPVLTWGELAEVAITAYTEPPNTRGTASSPSVSRTIEDYHARARQDSRMISNNENEGDNPLKYPLR